MAPWDGMPRCRSQARLERGHPCRNARSASRVGAAPYRSRPHLGARAQAGIERGRNTRRRTMAAGPTRILLQATIPATQDDWSIARFSRLGRLLQAARGADGERLYQVTLRDR